MSTQDNVLKFQRFFQLLLYNITRTTPYTGKQVILYILNGAGRSRRRCQSPRLTNANRQCSDDDVTHDTAY